MARLPVSGAIVCLEKSGFSLGRLHMGGGGSVNGGTHEEGIDLIGGPNFDRLYHKLKVLLQLHDAIYWLQFY